MRILLSYLILLVSSTAAPKGKPLPAINGEMMERIERLTLQLRLQEYPCSQTVFLNEIKEFPFLDLGGYSGSGLRLRQKLAITDLRNKVGYYGIYIYFGETEPGARIPPVEKSEVIFQPLYSDKFGVSEPLVLTPGFPQEYIDYMKELIRKLKITPSSFVRQLTEPGLPSAELEAKINAVLIKPTEK